MRQLGSPKIETILGLQNPPTFTKSSIQMAKSRAKKVKNQGFLGTFLYQTEAFLNLCICKLNRNCSHLASYIALCSCTLDLKTTSSLLVAGEESPQLSRSMTSIHS